MEDSTHSCSSRTAGHCSPDGCNLPAPSALFICLLLRLCGEGSRQLLYSRHLRAKSLRLSDRRMKTSPCSEHGRPSRTTQP